MYCRVEITIFVPLAMRLCTIINVDFKVHCLIRIFVEVRVDVNLDGLFLSLVLWLGLTLKIKMFTFIIKIFITFLCRILVACCSIASHC